MSDVTTTTPSGGATAGTTYTKTGYYSQCDMCGFKFKTSELVKQRGLRVCGTCLDEEDDYGSYQK